MFRLTREPGFEYRREERVDAKARWYEFKFATVDDKPVFAIFQVDDECSFFNDVPQRRTYAEEGRLRASAIAFTTHLIIRTAKKLPTDSETAKGGIKYIDHDVDRSYTVFQRDFDAGIDPNARRR